MARERASGNHLVACHEDKYDGLFMEKQKHLAELLSWPREVIAHDSPRSHFRFRANFQMWHDDANVRTPEGFFYAMYDENDKKTPQEITSFPRGTERINELMQQIRTHFTNTTIFNSLFEIRFLTTKVSPTNAIIVLCYKKPLPENWKVQADLVARSLQCKIIGRSRKVMIIAGDDSTDEYVQEELVINGKPFIYFQTEGAFSQPNAYVCEKMISWALKVTKPADLTNLTDDLLELYCGGGTFTAPLAQHFRKVLATEISRASVALANRCFAANNIENITVMRLSSEEFVEWHEGRLSNKVTSGINIANFNLQTVFVDPPRAGLDSATCNLLKRFAKIVYISCNPVTLARDVAILSETHDLIEVAAFDQFPYTHHLESGVVLIRRASSAMGEETKSEVDGSNDEQATKRQRLEEDTA